MGLLAIAELGEAPVSADAAPALPQFPKVQALPRGPLRAEWGRKTARVSALRVDLDNVGAHTHANWIFFRLPFDSKDAERIRNVTVEPSATIDPDVSALRLGMACVPYLNYGPIQTWAGYTAGAIGPTLAFSGHPSPPTEDPTIFGLNVPSRVANYVSCGREKSDALREPTTWHLDVTWDER